MFYIELTGSSQPVNDFPNEIHIFMEIVDFQLWMVFISKEEFLELIFSIHKNNEIN